MSPLPLDMPDDYPWLPSSARYPLADLGEHAVRLGSPVTFDRRGEVVWFDVGDKGLAPYIITGSGAGNKVKVDVLYPLHGSYNVMLQAGSDADCTSEIVKLVSNLAMRRSGFEVAGFVMVGVEAFEIYSARFDGSRGVLGRVRLNNVDKTLDYYGSDDAWHAIDIIGEFEDNYGVYHHLKLVTNFDSENYMRVLFDEKSYDLSTHELKTETSSQIACYRFYVRVVGRAGYNDTAYVGHVIVTGNEL